MGSKEKKGLSTSQIMSLIATKFFLHSDPIVITKSTLLNFQCEKLLIPTHPSPGPHLCDLVPGRPYNFLR